MDIKFEQNDESVRIKTKRLYKCTKESYILPRNKVWKDMSGAYFCNSCNSPVEDVTDRETGKEILRWI